MSDSDNKLLRNARLTDEEGDAICEAWRDSGYEGRLEELYAKAATAQALWACYDWLGDRHSPATAYDMERALRGMLEQAGIERPKGVSHDPS